MRAEQRNNDKQIFVAFSPYHLLLSLVLARNQNDKVVNHLVVVSDFGGANTLLDALNSWSQSPFASIVSLPGTYGNPGMLRTAFIMRRNARTIERLVLHENFDYVYVFNDLRAEAQAALYYSQRGNRTALGVYGEDGSAAYSSQRRRRQNTPRLILQKLLFGTWWEDVGVLGTCSYVDEVRALFPQFVRPELKLKPVAHVPRDAFLRLRHEEFLFNYLEAMGMTRSELYYADLILVVEHSDDILQIPDYRLAFEQLLASAVSHDLRVAIKYHPRDVRRHFISIADVPDVLILPRWLPIELVYLLAGHRIRYVAGDMSTALLTAKWLLDNTTVISLMRMAGREDASLLETFDKLGVKLVSNAREIDEALRA